MNEWHLHSRNIDEIVVAEDQFAAWNTLRTRLVIRAARLASQPRTSSSEPDR